MTKNWWPKSVGEGVAEQSLSQDHVIFSYSLLDIQGIDFQLSHQETILLELPIHLPARGNPETPPTSSPMAQHPSYEYQEISNVHEVVFL